MLLNTVCAIWGRWSGVVLEADVRCNNRQRFPVVRCCANLQGWVGVASPQPFYSCHKVRLTLCYTANFLSYRLCPHWLLGLDQSHKLMVKIEAINFRVYREFCNFAWVAAIIYVCCFTCLNLQIIMLETLKHHTLDLKQPHSSLGATQCC